MFTDSTINSSSYHTTREAICPMMYVNIDSYISKQPAISEEPMSEEDFGLIQILARQVNMVKMKQLGFVNQSSCGIDALEAKQTSQDVHEATRHNWFSFNDSYSCGEPMNFDQTYHHLERHGEQLSYEEVGTKQSNRAPAKKEFAFTFEPQFAQDEPNCTKIEEVSMSLGQKQKLDKDYTSSPLNKGKASAVHDDELGISYQNTNVTEELKENPKRSHKPSKARNNKTLSLRADVMNKNIFRALRRECKSIFDSFLDKHNLQNSKKKDIFMDNLNRFAENLLSTSTIDWENTKNFNLKDFSVYLGTFANYCAMKKVACRGDAKAKLEKVYSVLYKYSHVKFYEFITIPEIVVMIKIICEKSGKQNLLDNNDTLGANKATYEDHIEGLMSTINGVIAR